MSNSKKNAASTNCIYPIFEKCMKFTLDSYWRDIFAGCAENKFPHGMKYNPSTHTLYVKKDAKKATPIVLPEKPVEVFKRMMTIFKTDLELISSRDIEIQSEELEDVKKHFTVEVNCDWKKIKPRYLREQFIIDYVGKLRDKYSLTLIEVKKLLSTIHTGFQFKQLSSDDIDYSNGEILDIRGLEFDEKKRIFVINRPQRSGTTKNERNTKSTKFNGYCDHFLKDYQKRFKDVAAQ